MNPIIEGLLIIAKYDPNSSFQTNNEQIWYGSDSIVQSMSTKDYDRLRELQWFIDEESWSFII